MNNALPFGGMPVVFCGDFRQLLPVVRGGRGEYNTIQTCAWWREVTMLKLHHNWRCQQPEWLQLLDDIGMGRIDSVDIPAAATRPCPTSTGHTRAGHTPTSRSRTKYWAGEAGFMGGGGSWPPGADADRASQRRTDRSLPHSRKSVARWPPRRATGSWWGRWRRSTQPR